MINDSFSRMLCCLYYFRSVLIVIMTPLLLLPLVVLADSKEYTTLYVLLIMVVYWVTESLPIPATSLIPLFLFPFFGILTSKNVAAEYMQIMQNEATMLFVGSCMLAIAIESSELPQRLAIRVLLFVGHDPKWILMAIVSCTGFLSMWMSNTAITAMILPMVEAILMELIKANRSRNISNDAKIRNKLILDSADNRASSEETFKLDMKLMSEDEKNLCKMMFLSICYSANIGGVATLTGTPTNIVTVGLLEKIYGPITEINYASWMGFALPLSILNLGFVWLILLLFFQGFRKTFAIFEWKERENGKKDKGMKVVRSTYHNIDPMNFHQIVTVTLFLFLILLWIFRDPKFVRGWGHIFPKGFVSDTTTVMLVVVLLFVLPTSWPHFLTMKKQNLSLQPNFPKTPLDWQTIHVKFPWGAVFLIGGGFALASAIEQSGLSKFIGQALSSISYLSETTVCTFVAIIATFATDFATNTGVISVLVPILCSLAEEMTVNPLYIVLTAAICACYAFMLPIATPPNAIVFGYGYIRVIDVVKVGFFINWTAISLTILAANTWGYVIFNFGKFPVWAFRSNLTSVMNNVSFVNT